MLAIGAACNSSVYTGAARFVPEGFSRDGSPVGAPVETVVRVPGQQLAIESTSTSEPQFKDVADTDVDASEPAPTAPVDELEELAELAPAVEKWIPGPVAEGELLKHGLTPRMRQQAITELRQLLQAHDAPHSIDAGNDGQAGTALPGSQRASLVRSIHQWMDRFVPVHAE